MPTRNNRPSMSGYMELEQIQEILHAMELDKAYKTEDSYSANLTLHPNNRISFREKHLAYLKNHPQLNPEHYLSNLRLTTKIR